jgi:hypothetical protein
VRTTLSLVLMLVIGAMLVSGCAGETSTTSTSGSPTSSTSSSSTTLPNSTSTAPSIPSTTAAPTSTSVASPGGDKTFTAQLSGDDMVPPTETSATGSATFTVDSTGTHVHFVLKVSDLVDTDASRVHQGASGSTGPGVVILFAGPTRAGLFSGTVASGSFDASVLIGPLTGKTISDLVALFESGEAYVSVGTTENPSGEIRGQIR